MPCPTGTDVERAAQILIAGGLVAFPTETVYGLGGNALDVRAVARIFEAKQRPTFDPLIVHLANKEWMAQVAVENALARRLGDAFWPGPLTVVLPKKSNVPDLVTAGLGSIAVRVPNQSLALELLRRTGLPIAAPSANLFGQVSPTTASHVCGVLAERIDYVLDGGPCAVGLESTIIDLSRETPTLLRPGGLALEEIEALIGSVAQAPESSQGTLQLPAPGMLPTHYAPCTALIVAPPECPPPPDRRTGLLAFTPERESERFAAVEVLSVGGDLAEAASNLFAAIRRLDDADLDLIVARPVPNVGLGRAINDRLSRAATKPR